MNRRAGLDKAVSGLGARLRWFALIWLGSVAALGVVAMLIRWAVRA
jgi:hypothetical protein